MKLDNLLGISTRGLLHRYTDLPQLNWHKPTMLSCKEDNKVDQGVT
jgi:hypothetical protein